MPQPIKCHNAECTAATNTHYSPTAKRRCDARNNRALTQLASGARARRSEQEAPNRSLFVPAGALREHSARLEDGPALIGTSSDRISIPPRDLADAQLTHAAIAHADLGLVQRSALDHSALTDVRLESGLVDSTLTNLNATGVTVGRTVHRIDLTDSKLAQLTVLSGSDLDDVSLVQVRANASHWGAQVTIENSSLRYSSMRRSVFGNRLSFVNCDLTGLDLSYSRFGGDSTGKLHTFTNCEIDMTNWSGVDMTDVHMSQIPLDGRIYFADDATRPTLTPGGLTPTPASREFLTRSMTETQYAEYLSVRGVSEWDIRSAIARLSPAFTPVYDDGTVGERGELVTRALRGEDAEILALIQSATWEQSAEHNGNLAVTCEDVYP